ncbi:hypothetical protein Tco_0487344 [Tanacetum coccineum]
MANEEQDDQQQKLNKFDALLVPIDEQIKIRLGNFMIDLEKTQPDVIYKAFHYDITAKAYIFTLDDQNFQVNADLLREALQINPEVFDLTFEEFRFQIDSKKNSKQKQELLPFSRFTKLIIKHILSQNNHISKRLHSYQHIIKIDPTLGNLKFANKGAEDPVFGMPIPTVMLNDDIKASVVYAEYLTKSLGTQPATGKGKGKWMITKKDLKVALKNIEVPKKKWSETVFEESAQSKGVEADTVDSEETKEEDEIPLVRRQIVVVIGRQVHQESDEEALDHSKKLKGKGPNEGSRVTPAIPDEPSGSSSSSSSYSDDEIKDISSNDENDRAIDNEKAEAEKAKEEQFINDNPKVSLTDVLKEPEAKQPPQSRRKTKVLLKKSKKPETQVDTGVLDNRLTRIEKKVHVMYRFNPTKATDKDQRRTSSMMKEIDKTLLTRWIMRSLECFVGVPEVQDQVMDSPPAATTKITPPTKLKKKRAKKLLRKAIQRKNDSKKAIMKKLEEHEQMLNALAQINHFKAIKDSVKANMPKFVLKEVFDYFQPRLERNVLDVIKKNLIIETVACLTHDKHHSLYDALQESMQVNELQARYESAKPSRKKRSHNDHDPPENCEGEKNMKRRKGVCGSSSKKEKALVDTSNSERFKDANEPRQEQEEVAQHDAFI